jgi:biopolymer transport protein ExbB/TolQ
MLQLFIQGGAMMFPLALISMVLLGLAIRTSRELFLRGGTNTVLVENGLDGLLFWGFFAAMLGVLGQVIGYYKGFSEIVAYGLVSPRALWQGLAEGLTSTIAGLALLSAAGIFWFVLRWRHHSE